MLESVRERLRFFVPRVWRLAGIEPNSGQPLKVLYAGPESQYHFWARRMFPDSRAGRADLGRKLFLSVAGGRVDSSCPLTIFAAPRSYLTLLAKSSDLVIPWWIDAQVDPADALGPGQKESLKNDLRKVKSNGLTFDISRQPGDLNHFYEEMYGPSVRAAHGEAALPSSPAYRRRQVATGKALLLKVKQGERWIAGALIDLRSAVPVIRDIGVLGGDRAYLQMGAMTAAYFFSLQYLMDRGHRLVSMGLSRCLLDDGVLSYKRKWRPNFCQPSWQGFLVKVGKLDAATRAVLRSMACIAEYRGELFRTQLSDDVDVSNTGTTHLPALRGVPHQAVIDISGPLPSRQAGLG